jgi:hypothetical protein
MLTFALHAPTIQRRVHPPHVDQQTHHGHIHSRGPLCQKLVLEYLAALAAVRHGVEVDVSEAEKLLVSRFGLLVEDLLRIFEDMAQKIILYVLAPERDTIVFFQMANLVARIDRRHATVGIAARGGRSSCVVGLATVGRAL